MFTSNFVFCSLILSCLSGEQSISRPPLLHSLPPPAAPPAPFPPWITDSPAFQRPTETNSVQMGSGTISVSGRGQLGWLVHSNEKEGHGVEVVLETLLLSPEDFVLVAPWPLSDSSARVKLFSGKFGKMKSILIPNTKSFRLIYFSSTDTSSVSLLYRRYGSSIEDLPSPTERPSKKETTFEIQLKGKSPSEYSDGKFLQSLKTAVRDIAREYSIAHNIPFEERIPTDEMVLLHRISFCPLEWPEREVCASIEHSVFVSGERLSAGGLIKDYQLSADHLRAMWGAGEFPQLEALGLTLFLLPRVNSVVLYWSLTVALMVTLSLLWSCIFWKRNEDKLSTKNHSLEIKSQKKIKKSELKIGKNEKIPSFMFSEEKMKTELTSQNTTNDFLLKEKFEQILLPTSQQQPMKNYFGSIFFGSNEAYDEDTFVELRQKSK